MSVEGKESTYALDLGFLLDVWKIIDAMVVSLDRIGSCAVHNGPEQGLKALDGYFSSDIFRRLTKLRTELLERMMQLNPNIESDLEHLAEMEDRYWPHVGKGK